MSQTVHQPIRYIPPIRQRCRNCECFHTVTSARGAGHICRRNPPAVMPVTMHNPGHMVDQRQPAVVQGIQAVYPPTDPESWCGEWRIKSEGES